jgi:fatty-acyl-CoA synthase
MIDSKCAWASECRPHRTRARIANFKVPRYAKVVDGFEAIGMTASVKVQKNKLREHALRDFGLEKERT